MAKMWHNIKKLMYVPFLLTSTIPGLVVVEKDSNIEDIEMC